MKKIKLFTIAALMLGFVSCQKEDSKDENFGSKPAPTKQEMLAAKTWKISAMTVEPAWMGAKDLFPLVDACQKDNTWKFFNDAGKSLVIDEGSNICKGSSSTTTTTWALSPEGTKLTIESYDYTLESLNSDEFKMLETFDDKGVTYTITSTYSGN